MSTSDLAAYLQRIPLFATLTEEECRDLAGACTLRGASPGTVLCREGDAGLGLFFIEAGRARVTKRTAQGAEQTLGELSPSSVVGEMSLVDGLPRSATVTMLSDGTVWSLSRSDFAALRDELNPAAYKVLRHLAGVLCERLREINQNAESFWADPERTLEDLRARRAAGVRAEPPAAPTPPSAALPACPTARLDEGSSKTDVAGFLASVPLLSGLPREELEAFAEVLMPMPLAPGETLGHEGMVADAFYFVARGQLAVRKKVPRGAPLTLSLAGPGTLLGEVSLIDGGPRSATVVAPEAALVLRCDRDDFERLFNGGNPSALRFVDRLATDLSRRVREANARFADLHADSETTVVELVKRAALLGASLEGGEALADPAPLLRSIGLGES
ncbi:MAG: cyclic nucleotide-binding domain-containing protein [Myxococcales bacterium]